MGYSKNVIIPASLFATLIAPNLIAQPLYSEKPPAHLEHVVEDEEQEPIVGMPAYPFTFTDTLSGKQFRFPEDFKVRVVLLEMWGSWCVPCHERIPFLRELYIEYYKKGFDIIGIDVESEGTTLEKITKTLKEEGIFWHNFFDPKNPDNPLAKRYGVNIFPWYIIIDKNGNIAAQGEVPQCWKLGGGEYGNSCITIKQGIERLLRGEPCSTNP